MKTPATAAGWWQALTVGHPEFPPTLWFFRNTLVGDLAFTGLFAGVMAGARVLQTRRSSLDLPSATRQAPLPSSPTRSMVADRNSSACHS